MIQISTWKIILFSRCEVAVEKNTTPATEINFFKTFVRQFAASMLESKVQLAPPTKNVIMTVGYMTAFIAFETGRKLNSACCNYVHFSHQPLISVAQKISFPKSTEK